MHKKKTAANILFGISVILFLIVTIYFSIGFVQCLTGDKTGDAALGYGLSIVVLVALYLIVGSITSGVCAVLNIISIIVVNTKKEERGFIGVKYIFMIILPILTEIAWLVTISVAN